MQLVAVYEVLRDEEKRQMYNRVLVEGLPDWRTPVFYYRRARKMGFVELSALLALIITIGQYLFGWAVYVERRLTLVCNSVNLAPEDNNYVDLSRVVKDWDNSAREQGK